MSRQPILPSVGFGWYYFARRAARDRAIIANSSEGDTFRNLLATALVRHGVHLYFAYVDEAEMHLGIRAGAASLTKALGSFCEQFAHAVNKSRTENGAPRCAQTYSRLRM